MKFPHPEEFIHSLPKQQDNKQTDIASFLRMLTATSVSSHGPLISLLEIDRDQSANPVDTVFGNDDIDFLRRLVLDEERKIDFFYKPIGQRLSFNLNPFQSYPNDASANVPHLQWEKNQMIQLMKL